MLGCDTPAILGFLTLKRDSRCLQHKGHSSLHCKLVPEDACSPLKLQITEAEGEFATKLKMPIGTLLEGD